MKTSITPKAILTLLAFTGITSFTQAQNSPTTVLSVEDNTTQSIIQGPGYIQRNFDFPADQHEANLVVKGIEVKIDLTLGSDSLCTASGAAHHEDLNIRLVSPEGTSVDLVRDKWGYWTGVQQASTFTAFDQPGSGLISFSNEYQDFIGDQSSWNSGQFAPQQSLMHFEGEVATGSWTLYITDGMLDPIPNSYICLNSVEFIISAEPNCIAAVVDSFELPTGTFCGGSTATLNISGTLNDATHWAIYSGSCGGTLEGVTIGPNFVVTPSGASETYYVRGEGGCTTAQYCKPLTVHVDQGAPTGTATALNLTCSSAIPSPNSAQVNATDDSGVSTNIVWVSDISNGLTCPETITRTYESTDLCGNTAQIQQLISIHDTEAPVNNSSLQDVFSPSPIDNLPAPTATDNCAGLINATTTTTFPISTPGTTTVTWEFSDGCGNVSYVNQNVTIGSLSIEDLELESMELYPNPTSGDVISIKYPGTLESVSAFDMTGRSIELNVDLDAKQIKNSNLSPGKYLIMIETENGQLTRKELVVAHK